MLDYCNPPKVIHCELCLLGARKPFTVSALIEPMQFLERAVEEAEFLYRAFADATEALGLEWEGDIYPTWHVDVRPDYHSAKVGWFNWDTALTDIAKTLKEAAK